MSIAVEFSSATFLFAYSLPCLHILNYKPMKGLGSMNKLKLCGQIASEIVYSHSTRTREYSTFKLSIKRLSDAEDLPDIIVPSEVILSSGIKSGDFVSVDGQLRSYNNKNAKENKLKINAWALCLEKCEPNYQNDVELIGTVCKQPIYRQTPYGREITDLMLSVERPNVSEYLPKRYDYLPCITWGSVARMCADLTPHTKIHLLGRFQSRQYVKMIDGIGYDRTAYEISVSRAELEDEINEDTQSFHEV